MTSRKQDLRIRWQMAFVGGDANRCDAIENLILKEIKTADSMIKELHSWADEKEKKTETKSGLDQDLTYVQYWHNGIMMTARMSIEEAEKLVEDGIAYMLSDQAVGAIVDGKKAG